MEHRLTLKSIIFCAFIAATPLAAQPGTVPDEPITTGRWNEYHPAVSRSVSYGPNEWLVYERQTDDSSYIIAKKFRRQSPAWDSSEVIISRSSSAEGQCNPDIAWSEAYGLIAWQKKTAGTWNIYTSTYSKFTQVWSAPAAVTRETADCMNVRVGFLHVDSQFVAVWQSGRAVRMRKLPNDQSGTGDTIALSNLDAMRFDLGVDPYHPRGAVLYGITTGGRAAIVSKAFTYGPAFALEVGDTIRSAHSILNPRYLQSFWGRGGFFLYETPDSTSFVQNIYLTVSDPNYLSGGYYPILITNSTDPQFAYSNARGYLNPVVAGVGKNAGAQLMLPYATIVACEGGKKPDSTHAPTPSSVFVLTQNTTDTIASVGSNRNPILGANPVYMVARNVYGIPLVWESDRTGVTHLYGRIIPASFLGGIDDEAVSLRIYSLEQNYPNPFNPSTTIAFTLPAPSFVSLAVFDVMGREVASIESGRLAAGRHERVWNASAFSSGIYFYRLRAGAFTETKRLVLLR